VEKDYVEAYIWLAIAAARIGLYFGTEAANELDLLEGKMTPQQIANAQKRAKDMVLR
jgi:hypothetical protein